MGRRRSLEKLRRMSHRRRGGKKCVEIYRYGRLKKEVAYATGTDGGSGSVLYGLVFHDVGFHGRMGGLFGDDVAGHEGP
jgi:hypothetical protein